MRTVRFRYWGKYGHFLRAEANVDGITYPVPTRTVLLGLIGAVLGLGKDEPQVVLTEARLAVAGKQPMRFWHITNIRKDPPAPLPFRVKRTDRGTSGEQRNMRFNQEWLWKPDYTVWAALPAAYQEEFSARLRERRWHFTPCLGLAGMFAELEHGGDFDAEELPEDVHRVETLAPQEVGSIEMHTASEAGLTLQSLRMPCGVTVDRAFTHRAYWLEREARPFPFKTKEAVKCGDAVVVWM